MYLSISASKDVEFAIGYMEWDKELFISIAVSATEKEIFNCRRGRFQVE